MRTLLALRRLLLALALLAPAAAFGAEREDYLRLARLGWGLELRSGQDFRLPPREALAGGLCILGEAPAPATAEVLEAFEALLGAVFGARLPTHRAEAAAACPPADRLFLRLWSVRAPAADYDADVALLDARFGIGLRPGRHERIVSPGQTLTFAGREGPVTHMLVRQPGAAPAPLARAFYRSILVEELYQSLSLGLDILHLDRAAPFLSKLEEAPVSLRRLPWESEAFMAGLLGSNPHGLCAFDIFMLHALADPAAEAGGPALLAGLEPRFEALRAAAAATMARPEFGLLLDPACRALAVR